MLRLTERRYYKRKHFQSTMTAVEWRNVEMAEENAAFLSAKNSVVRFPYFLQVMDLWRVFYHSYAAARKYDGAVQIISSDYMAMDLFVAIFSTVEMLPKSAVACLLMPFLSGKNPTKTQRAIAQYYASYAANLQTTPFYDHKYHENRQSLTQTYQASEAKTWGDFFSWRVFVSPELLARKYISKPLTHWFHQEDNLVAPVTYVLVKFHAKNTEDKHEAQELFKAKLEKYSAEHELKIFNNHIYTRHSSNKEGTFVYACLSVSRYAEFQETLACLAKESIHLRKIAGQDRVQIKCAFDTENTKKLAAMKKDLDTRGVNFSYKYGDRISSRQLCLFDAPVRNLHKTIHCIEKHAATVSFIHNF